MASTSSPAKEKRILKKILKFLIIDSKFSTLSETSKLKTQNFIQSLISDFPLEEREMLITSVTKKRKYMKKNKFEFISCDKTLDNNSHQETPIEFSAESITFKTEDEICNFQIENHLLDQTPNDYYDFESVFHEADNLDATKEGEFEEIPVEIKEEIIISDNLDATNNEKLVEIPVELKKEIILESPKLTQDEVEYLNSL